MHISKSKISRSIIFSLILAGTLLLRNSSVSFADCGYARRGDCVILTMTLCPDKPTMCCDSITECGALDLAEDCDNPGAGGVPLGECLKLSNSQPVQEVYTTPSFLVNLIVDNLFVVAGIIIFFMTLLAGFFFITGGKKGLDQAKQILLAVIIGFGLMFGAYWIVQIIQTITGADILIKFL